jgi:hypothetical protein
MRYNVPIGILEKNGKIICQAERKLPKNIKVFKASSAACERMFSTAGNISSLKHKRMSVLLFTTLVFLKLNQELL